MKGFFKSSIGKKLIMSISGLFLISFLLVHLGLNLLILVDVMLNNDGKIYNEAAHFMGTNPIMKVMEPMLAIGFVIHIFYGVLLEVQNFIARGSNRYKKINQKNSSTWASRNMIWLGGFIFVFLIIHVINFFWKLKFGEAPHVAGTEMHDTYELVTSFFALWWYDVIYIIGSIFLGLHLRHAFWSAFQTIGLSNDLWRKRLNVIGTLYAIIVAGGFVLIPLYFLVFEILL